MVRADQGLESRSQARVKDLTKSKLEVVWYHEINLTKNNSQKFDIFCKMMVVSTIYATYIINNNLSYHLE